MATKVMVSFPNEFLVQVDEFARSEHRSRSELIREALRHYIAARQGTLRPGDLSQVRAAVESLNALAQITPGTGEDSTADVRHWRETRQ